MSSLWPMLRKEFRQMRRDKFTVAMLVGLPSIQLLLFGFAIRTDVRHVPMVVLDRSATQESRALVSRLTNTQNFDVAGTVSRHEEMEARLASGSAKAALVIPPDFERNISSRIPSDVQVIIDGDNANTASTVLGYSRVLITEFGAAQANTGDQASGIRVPVPSIAVEPRIWYNPQLRSTLFLVPGLIAYISMITAVVSTALSVVREKERGTMEQVRMAPISPLPYIIGKTLPYLAISFVSALLVIVTAMLLFDLPMRGSWLLLCGAIGLFLIGAQAQGLLISTIAQTQQVAFQVALLSSLLPTMILSGFIFPITSMPAAVQAITYVVPARYFLVALRAIVLKGAGLMAFWQDMVALAIFASVALGLASLRLRREWS